ncbi:protein ARV1-like [Babylonia areolata]|uniref:protein ARV1-like n=1 Tax=Babylonia areolata TaxID=304850 RepID=UPI003FD57743
MGIVSDKNPVYRCVQCGYPVRELYRDFKKGIIKISHCTKCGEVADKYIEYDSVIIFLDVLLLQRSAYRHILINTKFKGYVRFLLVLWLCDALTKLMQRRAGEASPRIQPDHVFYSALEWNFYQDYLLSAAESLVFFWTVIVLLAGKHFCRDRNLKNFECEAVLRALTLSSMGRLVMVGALVWGESYSAVGLALTRLFVAASNVQALRVVSKGTSLLQAGLAVLAGYVVVQVALLAFVSSGFPGSYSLASSIHVPPDFTAHWLDVFSR